MIRFCQYGLAVECIHEIPGQCRICPSGIRAFCRGGLWKFPCLHLLLSHCSYGAENPEMAPKKLYTARISSPFHSWGSSYRFIRRIHRMEKRRIVAVADFAFRSIERLTLFVARWRLFWTSNGLISWTRLSYFCILIGACVNHSFFRQEDEEWVILQENAYDWIEAFSFRCPLQISDRWPNRLSWPKSCAMQDCELLRLRHSLLS